MARLPQPGGDTGDWGDILNDYLSQSHSPEGILKSNSVGSSQLQPNSITSSAISPGAVTAAKVAADVATQAGLDAVANAVATKAPLASVTATLGTPSTAATGTLIAGQMALVNATSAAIARTLPAANSVAAGTVTGVKKIDGSVNPITVGRAGTDTITGTAVGQTARSLTLAGESVEFTSDGTSAWVVTSTDTPSTTLASTYTPLTGRQANLRRLLNQLKPTDYSPFTLSSDIPTVTVGVTSTITARLVGPQSDEVTEVGSRSTWDTASGRLPMAGLSGMDLIHKGIAIEFRIFAGYTGVLPIWVFIDGQPTTAAPDTTSVGSVSSSNTYFIKLTFGSARRRRIEFFCPAAGSWYGIGVGATDIVEPAPRKPVIAWVGDSFYGGSAGTSGIASAPLLASRQLGSECYVSGYGGTGYSTAGSFAKYGDSTRVSSVAAAKPDLIVFQGSVNDDGASTIATDAATTFAAYRAACPGASMVVLGSQPSSASATLSANRSANITAVKTAALAEPAVIGFHDMVGTAGGVPSAAATFQTYPDGTLVTRLGSVWKVSNGGASYSNGPYLPPTDTHFTLKTWGYYGTGQVGTTTGNGTRDTFLYSDSVHPTPDASQALADMTVAKIRSDLVSYVQTGSVVVD